jgi:hypothetical protein
VPGAPSGGAAAAGSLAFAGAESAAALWVFGASRASARAGAATPSSVPGARRSEKTGLGVSRRAERAGAVAVAVVGSGAPPPSTRATRSSDAAPGAASGVTATSRWIVAVVSTSRRGVTIIAHAVSSAAATVDAVHAAGACASSCAAGAKRRCQRERVPVRALAACVAGARRAAHAELALSSRQTAMPARRKRARAA